MFACYYRVVSGGVLFVMFCGISSGVCSELSRVFIELRVSDRDIKTLSKTELGSESSVCWRVLRTPFTGSPFCSSSLKRASRYVNRQLLAVNRTSKAKQHNLIYRLSRRYLAIAYIQLLPNLIYLWREVMLLSLFI